MEGVPRPPTIAFNVDDKNVLAEIIFSFPPQQTMEDDTLEVDQSTLEAPDKVIFTPSPQAEMVFDKAFNYYDSYIDATANPRVLHFQKVSVNKKCEPFKNDTYGIQSPWGYFYQSKDDAVIPPLVEAPHGPIVAWQGGNVHGKSKITNAGKKTSSKKKKTSRASHVNIKLV